MGVPRLTAELREALEAERGAWGTSSKRFRLARADTEAALAAVDERFVLVRERAERLGEVTATPGCHCGTCKALGRVRRAVLAEQEKEQP